MQLAQLKAPNFSSLSRESQVVSPQSALHICFNKHDFIYMSNLPAEDLTTFRNTY